MKFLIALGTASFIHPSFVRILHEILFNIQVNIRPLMSFTKRIMWKTLSPQLVAV